MTIDNSTQALAIANDLLTYFHDFDSVVPKPDNLEEKIKDLYSFIEEDLEAANRLAPSRLSLEEKARIAEVLFIHQIYKTTFLKAHVKSWSET